MRKRAAGRYRRQALTFKTVCLSGSKDKSNVQPGIKKAVQKGVIPRLKRSFFERVAPAK